MPTQYAAPITITRGWGGRQATVPLNSLHGFHVATHEGGRKRRLPHPMLGAYLEDCRLLPPTFDHDCTHGQRPHRIKILIPAHANTPIYDELWNRAAGRIHYHRPKPAPATPPRTSRINRRLWFTVVRVTAGPAILLEPGAPWYGITAIFSTGIALLVADWIYQPRSRPSNTIDSAYTRPITAHPPTHSQNGHVNRTPIHMTTVQNTMPPATSPGPSSVTMRGQ